jgi:Transmembrane exosortase (Exosortase_EpsH)
LPLLSSTATNAESIAPPRPRKNVDLVLGGLALAALWFILCRHLSGEWSVNDQYNYGWFVPFFALYLFWLRWEDRPRETGERKPESLILFSVDPNFLIQSVFIRAIRG